MYIRLDNSKTEDLNSDQQTVIISPSVSTDKTKPVFGAQDSNVHEVIIRRIQEQSDLERIYYGREDSTGENRQIIHNENYSSKLD